VTRPEAEWLACMMKKEGWPDVRVEPEVGSAYVVAYRYDGTEAHRRARSLSWTRSVGGATAARRTSGAWTGHGA